MTKDDFLTLLVDYVLPLKREGICSQRSSRRMASLSSRGDYFRILEYTRIYACLRDPIGGLKMDFAHQAIILQELLTTLIRKVADVPLGDDLWALLVRQLAQESSFLANPQIDDVAYVHSAVISSYYMLISSFQS